MRFLRFFLLERGEGGPHSAELDYVLSHTSRAHVSSRKLASQLGDEEDEKRIERKI
jgi:hypothetical protein